MASKEVIIDADRCFHCKHYLGDLTCLAFHDIIPFEILEGKNDHSEPMEGQDEPDLVFERGTFSADMKKIKK